ncbi:hypothetical protein [Peribacillus muralis]|uniref:hypothetical protein n=1 Tax=Peribacillus muralis TaxID=264697 RepID=UPI00366AD002
MRVYLRPRRLKAEEAQVPPVERERLQCNETVKVHHHKTEETRGPFIIVTQSGMKRKVRDSCGKCVST